MSKNLINQTYCLILLLIVVGLVGCAMMPRTVLDTDSGTIIESTAISGKYKINIFPLNQTAVAKNGTANYVYTIGNRDQVTVMVWGHPEFSSPLGTAFTADQNPLLFGNTTQVNNTLQGPPAGATNTSLSSYTVDENGNIFLPLIGLVKLESKTITQVRKDISVRLSEYVVDPQVSVRMAAYRSKLVYVLGEVTKPTAIYLNDVPLDLAGALSLAGWVTLSSADVKNIYVLRLIKQNTVDVYRLDATTPTALLFANTFLLQANDVVFVSTAGVAQFNRVMTQFLNAAQAVWFTANLATTGKVIVTN